MKSDINYIKARIAFIKLLENILNFAQLVYVITCQKKIELKRLRSNFLIQ